MEDKVSKDNPLIADYKNNGKIYKFRYYELGNYDHLDPEKIKQVYGVCFYQDKMVIVLNGKKKTWGLLGGKPEKGESIQQTLEREVKEESNMQVLKWRPIGIQEVTDPDGNNYFQLRVACKVKPLGDCDLIKLIDPLEYKNYFDWGEIGDKIINRASQIKSKL
ncbi:MAG: NUDIX hydrolase [Candidatus Daviesbacteria bacterium]|nr:NUDIX hydrolase [Candidatus Daviesbacteria bacterium]